MWQVGPLCLFWTIWKARNYIVFEDKPFSLQKAKTSFLFLLWSETKASISNGPLTLAKVYRLVGLHVSRGTLVFLLVLP